MPYGDSATYLQAFTFQAEPVLGEANSLQIGSEKVGERDGLCRTSLLGDWCRAGQGDEGRAMAYKHRTWTGTTTRTSIRKVEIVALSISSPDGVHPHSKFLAYHDLRSVRKRQRSWVRSR